MKAILPIKVKDGDKTKEEMRLFDTEISQKVCTVVNAFGYEVQEIYLSPSGIVFLKDAGPEKLSVGDQDVIKKYIGEKHPEEYIKFFGEVKEA